MIDWKGEAAENGFDSPRQMFQSLYIEKGWSTERIAEMLSVSQQSVINGLKKFKVPLRRRGGRHDSAR